MVARVGASSNVVVNNDVVASNVVASSNVVAINVGTNVANPSNPPVAQSWCAQVAKKITDFIDAFIDTLLPAKSKGVKYALEVAEHSTAILGTASQVGTTAAMTRGMISMPFALGPVKYFIHIKDNKEATVPQACGMFLIGVISTLSTLNFLNNKFNVRTLSLIATTVGKVALMSLMFPVLALGIGICMLWHERISWMKNTDKLTESRLEERMWVERQVALETFKKAQTPHNWSKLKLAGDEEQVELKKIWNKRVAHLPEAKKTEQMNEITRSANGNNWVDLLGDHPNNNITICHRQNNKNSGVYRLNKLQHISEKIDYKIDKSTVDVLNSNLYREKALWRIACSVMEVAVAVIVIAGLFTGVGALAMTGTLFLTMSLAVATMALYTMFHENYNPSKALKAKLLTLGVKLDYEGVIHSGTSKEGPGAFAFRARDPASTRNLGGLVGVAAADNADNLPGMT